MPLSYGKDGAIERKAKGKEKNLHLNRIWRGNSEGDY
jgi:hypothetical protein